MDMSQQLEQFKAMHKPTVATAEAEFAKNLSAVAVDQARALAERASEARQNQEGVFQPIIRPREASLIGDGLVLPVGAEDVDLTQRVCNQVCAI